jgi:hypothetical protein
MFGLVDDLCDQIPGVAFVLLGILHGFISEEPEIDTDGVHYFLQRKTGLANTLEYMYVYVNITVVNLAHDRTYEFC